MEKKENSTVQYFSRSKSVDLDKKSKFTERFDARYYSQGIKITKMDVYFFNGNSSYFIRGTQSVITILLN